MRVLNNLHPLHSLLINKLTVFFKMLKVSAELVLPCPTPPSHVNSSWQVFFGFDIDCTTSNFFHSLRVWASTHVSSIVLLTRPNSKLPNAFNMSKSIMYRSECVRLWWSIQDLMRKVASVVPDIFGKPPFCARLHWLAAVICCVALLLIILHTILNTVGYSVIGTPAFGLEVVRFVWLRDENLNTLFPRW